MTDHHQKPRVFIDADVLFAGAASPNQYSASLVILRMAEITLIKALTSQQVINEVERNLEEKIPAALITFRMLVSRCLEVVPDPTKEDGSTLAGAADPKELPILAETISHNCQFLTTYNIKHFQPGVKTVTVLAPGDLVQRVRYLLASI